MTFDNVLLEPTLNSVKGLMIMDNNGARILAKYYDAEMFPNTAAQKKFEKTLFTKTHKANAEIIMLDGLTCLYKSSVDLFFYVLGSGKHNCPVFIETVFSFKFTMQVRKMSCC